MHSLSHKHIYRGQMATQHYQNYTNQNIKSYITDQKSGIIMFECLRKKTLQWEYSSRLYLFNQNIVKSVILWNVITI